MSTILVKLTALLGLAAVVAAAPTQPLAIDETDGSLIIKRAPNCNALSAGLIKADCDHMAKIGMAGMGANPKSNTGKGIWVGTQGPNKFVFNNRASPAVPITVIVWNNPAGDYQSSFMNVRAPQISYSLAAGASVTVSVANGVSGGFAALYNRKTVLSQYGQIYNTWGEFTSGQYATVDVSREVHMGGNPMSIKTSGGCVSDMDRCVFVCKNGKNTCGEAGTYDLKNCAVGSQPGATIGYYNGQPEGGCQGWSNSGTVTVDFKG